MKVDDVDTVSVTECSCVELGDDDLDTVLVADDDSDDVDENSSVGLEDAVVDADIVSDREFVCEGDRELVAVVVGYSDAERDIEGIHDNVADSEYVDDAE